MELFQEIPADIETGMLTESVSDTAPAIRREGGKLVIPVFARQKDDGYHYFEIPVEYRGQNTTDYAACSLSSYAELRAAFYGDWRVQNEQILKGTFTAHQYAVKRCFPKCQTEEFENVSRFETIRTTFWQAVDSALQEMGETRAVLPDRFDAEWMLAHVENRLSAARIGYYRDIFSVVSLNLLHNRRNWEELFNE